MHPTIKTTAKISSSSLRNRMLPCAPLPLFALILLAPILFAPILFAPIGGGQSAYGQDALPESAAAAAKPSQTKTEPPTAEPPTAEPPTAEPPTAEPAAKPQSAGPLDVTPSPPVDADASLKAMGYQDPIQNVLATLADPPGAKRLSKKSSLWVDTKNKRVYVDGYISLRDAPLEMFACPAGTKEHESIVATLARSSEVHAALLAVGAMSGTTVKFDPKYVPATGQRIRVWVMYRDADGKFKYADARSWVRHGDTERALEMDWVFAGSTTWVDPEDGKSYYQADGGELICVSNFGTALMDLPIESSDSNSSLQFMAYTDRIPADLTPVRLMLVPIPIPSDRPSDQAKPAANPDQPPEQSMLPLKPTAQVQPTS